MKTIASETQRLQRETDEIWRATNWRGGGERWDQLQARLQFLDNSTRHRPFTNDEHCEAIAIATELDRMSNTSVPLTVKRGQPLSEPLPPGCTRGSTLTPQYMAADGSTIHCLSPHEKFADLPTDGDNRQLSLGKAIRGLITGRWENAREERLAMSEGGNSQGGWLVPAGFSRQLIDLARARSVCVQAGTVTLPWDSSDTLTLAAVRTDPTFEEKVENAEFSGTDIAFEAFTLTAKTIGNVAKLSRELAEDSVNAPQLIENVLAAAFATELDRLALNGSGSQELVGLLNKPSVPVSNASVGAATWEAFHEAATVCRLANHEPSAIVLNPRIEADLNILASGDGMTLAKTWLGSPPSLATVRRYSTTSCPLAKAVVGDFSNLIIGIRSEAQLEVSTSASTAFSAHQVWVKLVFRGDCCAIRPSAFATLGGLTT